MSLNPVARHKHRTEETDTNAVQTPTQYVPISPADLSGLTEEERAEVQAVGQRNPHMARILAALMRMRNSARQNADSNQDRVREEQHKQLEKLRQLDPQLALEYAEIEKTRALVSKVGNSRPNDRFNTEGNAISGPRKADGAARHDPALDAAALLIEELRHRAGVHAS